MKNRKKLYSEKASATLIVFITVFFILIILGTILTTVYLKRRSQLVEIQSFKEAYDADMDETYEEAYKNRKKYIGKYVDYKPDNATYSKDLLGVNYTGSSSNSSDFTTEEYTYGGSGFEFIENGEDIGELINDSSNKITKIKSSTSYNVEDYDITFAETHGAGLMIDSADRIIDDKRRAVIERGEYSSSYMWNTNGWTYEKLTEIDTETEEYTGGWRILDYDEKTGEMIIVMAQPTKDLYLAGARGYNNGVDVLNDMCAKLFSKKTDGWNVEARSITIEDIEDRLNETGIAARDEDESNHTKDYDDSNKGLYDTNRKYPTLYAKEIGSGTAGTGEVKTTGLGWSERNPNISYNASDVQFAEAPTKLTVTHTAYAIMWNKSYFKDEDYVELFNSISGYYWLATRGVSCYAGGVADFGLRYANSKCAYGWESLYDSRGVSDYGNVSHGLRAVVELGTGIKVDTSESGDDIDHPYKITK